MSYTSSPDDPVLRRDIAQLICDELNDSASDFFAPDGFHIWVQNHKVTLRGLFGGQGIQNLERVVAWAKRYFAKGHRLDTLRLIAKEMPHCTNLPPEVREALAAADCFDVFDLLKRCLLNPPLAMALTLPLTQDKIIPKRVEKILLAELRKEL